jgi:SAM-dependent methyltransferase
MTGCKPARALRHGLGTGQDRRRGRRPVRLQRAAARACRNSTCWRTTAFPLRQIAGESGRSMFSATCANCLSPRNSIDLVVMPHVLEFHDDPHQILREVERILIPGRATGHHRLQPALAVGLARRLPNCPDDFPQRQLHFGAAPQGLAAAAELRSRSRQLRLLRTALCIKRWLKRWHFMEAAGDRWWSFAGGVYLLRAVKRVRGMRLICRPGSKSKAPRKALTAIAQKGIRTPWR